MYLIILKREHNNDALASVFFTDVVTILVCHSNKRIGGAKRLAKVTPEAC